jgi:hypothetical protein
LGLKTINIEIPDNLTRLEWGSDWDRSGDRSQF